MYLLLCGLTLALVISIIWQRRLSRKIRQYTEVERQLLQLEQQYAQLTTTISDRKRSEEALQKSEAHQRALLTAIPDLIMRVNRAGVYLEITASPNFQVIGDAQGWGVGVDIHCGLPPELAKIRLEAIHLALENRSIQIYEQTLTFDDRIQYEEVRVVPYSDDEVLLLVRDISDRQLALNQLQQSEQRFRHAIEVAPFPIMIHAEDGEVLQLNSVWTELTGYKHTDIARIQDWVERAYGERQPLVQSGIDQLYGLSVRQEEGEFTITTREGKQRIWQFSSAPLEPLLDGRHVVISMAVDVTEHRRAELALRDSEERYRSIYDQAAVGLVNTNFDTQKFVNVNPRFCEMLGYSYEELLAKTVIEMTHPDDRGRIILEVEKLIKGDIPYFFQEKRYLRKDGSTLWSLTGVSIVRDALGNPKHTMAIVQDITERKWLEAERQQAETALRDSEARLRVVTENMSDLVCLHHPDGRYLYVTPSSEVLLGYRPDALIGQNLYEFVHPQDRDRIREESHPIALQGEPRPIIYRMRRSTGEYLWLETVTQPIFDGDGKVLHLQTTSRDVSERVRAKEQLKYDALHDGLTGLPNRNLLMERLDLVLKRAKRHADVQFAVLFLDLDNFKVINDSLGHSVGDALLMAVANQLKIFIRETDVAARLGGDEFVLLIEDIDGLTEAIAIAKRILEALKVPFLINEREVFTSASIGILPWDEGHRTAEDLLRDADLAMYRAKQNGREQYAIFNPNMHLQAMQRLHLENELRRGLENREFVLYYQPIISLSTGRLKGFEALIRWQHPERGLILPGDFIPIAEETRLIMPIGQWILQTACAQMAVWQAQFPAQMLWISVNLSAQQLQPKLLEHLDEALGQSNVPGDRLVLEITESMLVQNLEATDSLLKQIKNREVHLSIDDFGTGYSSLSYLHRLPADALKIDRTFVSPSASDARNQAIAESIVALSNLLELKAIAEGIETLEQLEWLQSLDCELGQGNYFSSPVSAHQATMLITQRVSF